MRSKPAILAISAALVGAMVGGALAFTSARKSVTLSVDGRTSELSSSSSTVGDVLEEQGVRVRDRDAVAPSPGSRLHDGTRIAVRHARPLSLVLDDTAVRTWVTATDVEQAVDQLGVRDGAHLSASRSTRIPLSGMQLKVRTPRTVTVVADHRRRHVTTTAGTVQSVLDQAGLHRRGRDRVSPPPATFPRDHDVITLTRVTVKRRTVTVSVPYRTVHHSTSSLYKGHSRVTRAGHTGHKAKTFRVTVVDGKRTSRHLVSSRWLDRPRHRVVEVGTKSRAVHHSSTSSSGGSYSVASDGLNWSALAQCESGGNPQAVNPAGPYYGLYQFTESTWRSVGGSGLPTQASSAEQTHRAQILYQRSGAGQWPVCGKNL